MSYRGQPGAPYHPSNGTEGRDFVARFCYRCQRDRPYREGTGPACTIQMITMLLSPTDSEYPREWQYDADGQPTCTAFEAEGE